MKSEEMAGKCNCLHILLDLITVIIVIVDEEFGTLVMMW
jgi:hypothetical protein